MARSATKAAENIFYLARMDAAKFNESLCSREGAGDLLGIDRTRLARIELGTQDPNPEDAMIMAETYNCPDLCNHYCSRICRIGKDNVPEIQASTLERATIRTINAVNELEKAKETLLEVSEDGLIDQEEMPVVRESIKVMNKVVAAAEEFKLMCKKLLGDDYEKNL